jgi:hypothetical protein
MMPGRVSDQHLNVSVSLNTGGNGLQPLDHVAALATVLPQLLCGSNAGGHTQQQHYRWCRHRLL